MPPAKDTPAPAPATALRALAIAICLTIAGCQSQAPSDLERTDRELGARLETPPDWLEVSEAQSEPQDIWARIRAGFQLQDLLDTDPRIERQRLLMASRAESIEQASKRSEPYIHYIVERLEERDMPLELALLPVIESAYTPVAYSRAHAVGLWQFIPSTGLHFNLRQTRWYDGRRDITASTDAALRYLDYLHDLFDGDWLLALAAYNAGEGTVSRAIERNQRQGLPTDYWNLKLPQETQNYVPKLLALSQLVANAESYGISLSPVANEPYFQAIPLDQRLDLSRVAKLAQMDEDELYRLNPAFTRRVTFDGPKQLLVPAASVELLAANLAQLQDEPIADWQQYRVRPGDTLGAIAKRYKLSVGEVRELNQLRSNQLRIGQVLTIPAPPAETPRGQLLQAVARNEEKPRSYRVKPGDNLWDIAAAHQVTVQDLQRWNRLSGSRLTTGQTLLVQRGAAAPAPASGKATYYKVRKGDSLYEIARRFNIELQHLRRWNPGSAVLKPGQTLTLYLPR